MFKWKKITFVECANILCTQQQLTNTSCDKNTSSDKTVLEFKTYLEIKMTSLSNKKIILTVVRHGQTNGNKESILQGQNGAKVFLNSHLEILSIHKVIWRIY